MIYHVKYSSNVRSRIALYKPTRFRNVSSKCDVKRQFQSRCPLCQTAKYLKCLLNGSATRMNIPNRSL